MLAGLCSFPNEDNAPSWGSNLSAKLQPIVAWRNCESYPKGFIIPFCEVDLITSKCFSPEQQELCLSHRCTEEALEALFDEARQTTIVISDFMQKLSEMTEKEQYEYVSQVRDLLRKGKVTESVLEILKTQTQKA